MARSRIHEIGFDDHREHRDAVRVYHKELVQASRTFFAREVGGLQTVLPARPPLDGEAAAALLVGLHVLEHLAQGIHAVAAFGGVEEEALVVARVDGEAKSLVFLPRPVSS